jgi:hypothetical protein
MTLEIAQEFAPTTAQELARLDAVSEIRIALSEPEVLRERADALLAAVPEDCDLLTWSPEGHSVALVASIVGLEADRDVKVHHASLLAPLATRLREDAWSWVCAEEILGFGPVRSWAIDWARQRGGRQRLGSTLVLSVLP